jgi:ABC-type nitrate/sulfonate/bicarbonate transport system ATPase subunit
LGGEVFLLAPGTEAPVEPPGRAANAVAPAAPGRHARAIAVARPPSSATSAAGASGLPAPVAAAVVARGVRHRFRLGREWVPALAGVDMEAAPGEFVGLIGPSGCGKSTLLSLIAGLDEPDGGEVLVGGRGPGRLGRVALMLQKDCLLPWKRLADNVALGLELQGVARAEARRRAAERLAAFGLGGFERAYPAALSGGMRQRAALLRTFLAGKPALLLDEPLGALDSLTRQDVQLWLQAAWLEFRPTIVLVTHDVEEALFLCDRVYVLSPRPARVTAVLPVDLARPREAALRTDGRFVALKERLLAALGAARKEDA